MPDGVRMEMHTLGLHVEVIVFHFKNIILIKLDKSINGRRSSVYIVPFYWYRTNSHQYLLMYLTNISLQSSNKLDNDLKFYETFISKNVLYHIEIK